MKILLVGAGGYGTLYVKELLKAQRNDIVWEGIVDPYFSACAEKARIEEAGIPVYETMDAFYREHEADLAVICTPPFLHCEQSICALSHGSFVLCEKPVAPTVEEAERMLAAQNTYHRFIAIGYQWSFSKAIRALKKDVLAGVLGKPVTFKTLISWPRNFAYYRRGGGWGGKVSKDGVLILDSIASNACAHYFHNMLYLLGKEEDESASVTTLAADCLRANDIETFDTCTIRAKADDVTLYFAASHATERNQNPAFSYTFTNATVDFSEDAGSVIRARFADGSTKEYGDPFCDTFNKLWDCVDAISAGTTPVCTVKTAMEHTKMIAMLHREIPFRSFAKEEIRLREDESGLYVTGLFETLCRAYDEEKLLSEL